VTFEQFKATLAREGPPAELDAPLAALWWMAKGDWQRAHGFVDHAAGRNEAWVHAHLHRVEGDLANARYWYGEARREPATGSLAAEREQIARTLLANRGQT
jgi:hypothetical protein